MWSGCRLPNAVVSQAHSGKPKCVMAFLHLRQPASLLHLGKRLLWVVWYNSEVARLRNKGGKSALVGFKYLLGLSEYGGGH